MLEGLVGERKLEVNQRGAFFWERPPLEACVGLNEVISVENFEYLRSALAASDFGVIGVDGETELEFLELRAPGEDTGNTFFEIRDLDRSGLVYQDLETLETGEFVKDSQCVGLQLRPKEFSWRGILLEMDFEYFQAVKRCGDDFKEKFIIFWVR